MGFPQYSLLSRISRLRLGHPRSLGLGRLFVKRDDLTGLAFGGNKVRNLEFRLADAQEQGADVVIAGLEAQSNSARQTTAAANLLGMRTSLLLRADRDWGWQGNLLVDRLLGAEVRLLETDDPAALDEALVAAADEQRGLGRPIECTRAVGDELCAAQGNSLLPGGRGRGRQGLQSISRRGFPQRDPFLTWTEGRVGPDALRVRH